MTEEAKARRRVWWRAYYQVNRAKLNLQRRAYRAAHAEPMKAKRRARDLPHRERSRMLRRKRYCAGRPVAVAYAKAYRRALKSDPAKRVAQAAVRKRYRAANLEAIRRWDRQYFRDKRKKAKQAAVARIVGILSTTKSQGKAA